MKEKVCCILDSDENYAVRLTDYINERKALPYKALAFSSGAALEACRDKYEIKLLLEGGDGKADLELINPEVYIRLSEEENIGENQVYRYQSAERIIKDLASHISGFSRKYSQKRTAEIISVYSPATKCFKTTLALGIAAEAAKRGRTLFISLEQFSGLGRLLSGARGGLSDALYYYKSGKEAAFGKILSCADSILGFDFFAPAVCADDIAEQSDGEMTDFVYLLAERGDYARIIADVGCVFNKPWRLLEASERIIMPAPLDYMGRKKASEFENYLLLSGRSEVERNIFKIDVPYDEALAGYEITAESVQSEAIRRASERCLNG
ncbi:MAG: hypothetical protein NC223_00560 [Butyrivibrio sp.]|nr:hypothetical protein [Butyrivibrio sp.]